MSDFRGKFLAILAKDFTGEQIRAIESALNMAMVGYEVKEEETGIVEYGDDDLYLAREFLARKKSKGLSEGTLYNYRFVIETFCVSVGKRLKDVRDLDVIRFLDGFERSRQIGKSRKNNMRVILNGFFRFLIDTGNISVNPMATIEKIKCEKRLRKSLTDVEMIKLRKACRTPKEKALIEVLFSTGCRVSEIANMDISDVDFEAKEIRVIGKGNKERVVFLNSVAVYYLREYLETRKDRTTALFVSDRAPYKRMLKPGIENRVREIGERCLNRRVFCHLLRHTCACYLLTHGMTIDQVQIILGHESIETTRIYAKTDLWQVKNAYRVAMAA